MMKSSPKAYYFFLGCLPTQQKYIFSPSSPLSPRLLILNATLQKDKRWVDLIEPGWFTYRGIFVGIIILTSY